MAAPSLVQRNVHYQANANTNEMDHQVHQVGYSLGHHRTRFQDSPAMLKTLPFDTGTMLSRLKPWIECESPTYDAVAVNGGLCGHRAPQRPLFSSQHASLWQNTNSQR